jgi:protein O-GlcNAc transferase
MADPTAEHLNADGLAALAAGDRQAAPRAYRRALALAPGFLAALGNLANFDADSQAYERACRGYRRALSLMPGHAGLLMMMGTALLRAGRETEGEHCLRQALEIDPAYPKAHINLGLHALQKRRLADAERHLRLALKGDPGADLALAGLSRVLSERPSYREARRAARQATAIAPSSPQALGALRQVGVMSGDIAAATRVSRRALVLSNDPTALTGLGFCLHYDPAADSAELASLYRRWASVQARPDPRPHPNVPDAERRLKIGYLSADLYDHPVGRNLIGLFEAHDPGQVEIHVYAEHPGSDAMTTRLKAAASAWRSTTGLSDPAVAESIRRDGIDILVVVAGHTLSNRISVAALKPAPVQLGIYDFSTSGLSQMDGFLSDPYLSPEGGEEQFSEDVIRLPCLYLHMPIDNVPLRPRSKGPLLLGSCNNPAKLNDKVIALWSRVLQALPEARLALKYRDAFGDRDLVDEIKARFRRHEIASSRIVFDGKRVDRRTHLSFVGGLDISLDPFPFNGCTTSFEALWMGVPVVTLAGRRFVGRATTAALALLGLSDLAAETEDGYVDAVLRLAADGARRERLRAELRGLVKASPLLDASAHGRAMEAAFRARWRDWCASRPLAARLPGTTRDDASADDDSVRATSV